MRRTYSSPLTVFWKFIFPALLIGGWSYGTVQWLGEFRNRDGPAHSSGEIWLAIVSSAALVACYVWWAKRLKRVEADDHALYISNYITEIRVPLSELTAVSERRSGKHFTLSIELRNPSAFGKRIVFRPRPRLYWSGIHPVARELHALCEKAEGNNGVDHAA
jgi:hypothetical protein